MELNRLFVIPETLQELERQARDMATRWRAGHGNVGDSVMDSLYANGVMRTLKPSSVKVLGCIREHTERDPKGRAKLTYEDIRQECGIGSDETVATAVAPLIDIGLVEKQHTHNQTAGWRAPNIYRVTPGSKKFLAYIEHCRACTLIGRFGDQVLHVERVENRTRKNRRVMENGPRIVAQVEAGVHAA